MNGIEAEALTPSQLTLTIRQKDYSFSKWLRPPQSSFISITLLLYKTNGHRIKFLVKICTNIQKEIQGLQLEKKSETH